MATCSACGRTFHTEKELQVHDKEMHRGKMTGSAERMGERAPALREAGSAARSRTIKVSEEEWRMLKKAREESETHTEEKAKKERKRETGKAY